MKSPPADEGADDGTYGGGVGWGGVQLETKMFSFTGDPLMVGTGTGGDETYDAVYWYSQDQQSCNVYNKRYCSDH